MKTAFVFLFVSFSSVLSAQEGYTCFCAYYSEFPGGDKALREYISANLVYPPEARADRIEGKVYLQFTVDTSGYVSEVIVMRSLRPDCDAAAVSVLKSLPKWQGSWGRKPVKTVFNLPVVFQLI